MRRSLGQGPKPWRFQASLAAVSLMLVLVTVLLVPAAFAADVVTDGNMEAAGIGAWPHTNVTDVNSSAKATDQSASGQSLKGTSATGQRIDVEWYNAQTIGTVGPGDTVTLSLWWGVRFNTSFVNAQGDLFVDVKPTGGTWAADATTVWTFAPNTSVLTFQSGTVTNADISDAVSGAFPATQSYDVRLRFAGRTGRNAAANVNTWWDDVVIDVATPAAQTTVGNGTNPANASRCPGDGAAELDAFTLQTSAGTDTVSAVQVTFAAGTAAALSLVEITDDAGATVYGSVANPAADVVNVPLTTNITATTTLTQYKVRITPKSHAALPAPPGTSYAVTGTVTDVTAGNPKTLNDTASATVTVDNASPGDATWGTVTPGDAQVALNWTNPGDADFSQVVILRSTATIVDAPVEGATYTAGNTIGAATVVYAGAGTTFTDTGVSNGTNYWYKVFAKDACGNYSAGVQTGPHLPNPPAQTTVGNGTDPGNASLCPGDGATELDAFTVQASVGTDMVTAVQVTLAAGTSAGVALVEITNNAGAVVYGSVTNPASDVVNVTLTTNINVSTVSTQYRVRITPKTHAAMPAPPGASYAVTGTVTDVTASNPKTLSDTASATVTIDNASPGDATWGAVTPGDAQVALGWTNPGDADFSEVVILRGTAAIADAPAEGAAYVAGNTIGAATVVYAGAGTSFTDTGVANGTDTWYKVFAKDACGNYAVGVQTGPHRPAPTAITAGTATGSVSVCTITIDAPFTGDGDGDSTIDVQAKQATNCNGGGYLSIGCDGLTGPSPRQCVNGGLLPATDYCYLVTWNDPDGVNGTNPQRVGPLTTDVSCGGAPTTTVGNGTDPASSSICPATTGMLDAFTLQTDTGTDTVTNVRVSLSPLNVFQQIGLIEITSDDGTVVHGSTTPASDTVDVAVALPVTTTLVQYKVRITAKDHAALTLPSPAVTGTVTDVTVTDGKTLSDSTSATVTIDNNPAAEATWTTTTPGDGQVTLAWTNPGDVDFADVVVLRSTAPIADAPTDGQLYAVNNTIGVSTVRYAGSGTGFVDPGLTNGTPYTYKVFTRDVCGNYSAGVQTGPHTPTAAANNFVTPGNPSAVVGGCDQVTVNAPFTDDANTNSTTTVSRGTSPGGPFGTTICASLSGPSPRVCVDNTVAASTTYYYEVTFSDPDGVNGTNPRVTGAATTPACAANDTTVTSNSATATTCKQITVTSVFVGDADGDGSTQTEFSLAGAGAWQRGCDGVTGTSPRQCILPGLSPSTSYDVRVTFSDPDGVTGPNPETLASIVTPACGGDQSAPTVLVLSPARESTVGGVDVVKIQVFEPNLQTVQVSVDGDVFTNATLNPSYTCGVDCGVWEWTLDVTALANEAHYLTVRATDTSGNVALVSQPFRVSNVGVEAGGDGFLLRRTRGSQLCVDCHVVQTHSSQTTSDKYGNWAIDCLTCHTPHLTENIQLIRENVRTPNGGLRPVSFIADATGTDFTTPAAPYTGICEVCHTRTSHHRGDDSGGDHTHNETAACTACHEHDKGFTGGGCNGCHNAPPVAVGKHAVHDQVWDSTDGNTATSYEETAPHATATQYGFACAKCHSGTHQDDAVHDGTLATPYQVDVVFDATALPQNPGGGYAGVYNQSSEGGGATPSGEYWSYSNGTCSNLYCHSNANPLGGTNVFQTVTWEQIAGLGCTGCHDTGGAASALSNAHRLHTDGGKYNFGCVRCHDATVADNATIGDKTFHVNGTKNVVFDATYGNDVGGSYDDVGHSCSGTYCHSDGQTASPPYPVVPSIAWNTTATCRSCHGNDASAAPTMASGKHTNHVNNLALLGTLYGCVTCHNATVSDNTTISGYANHVNGTPTVSMATGTWTKPNCNNSECHSSGQATPEFYAPNWVSDSLDCRGCHGRHSSNAFVSVAGEPNYTNGGAGTATANSHRKHVTASTACANCHNLTVSTSDKIDGSDPTRHIDGTRDIAIAAAWDTNGATSNYTAGSKTCNNVACHGAGTPQWGGQVLCLDCHGGVNDVDDWNITNDVAAIISISEWQNVGHGQASVGLPGTNPCLYCHDDGVNHSVATNPFRLANFNATGDGWNSTCLTCHKSTAGGYNPGSGLKTSTVKIDAYHFGADHGAGNDGGSRCWDCHDPHGDDTNIKMVGDFLIRDGSDVYGLVATRTAIATVFTANAAGSDFATTSAPFNKVCNVCHQDTGTPGCEAGNHYTANCGSGHNLVTVCTSCHIHDQPPSDAFKPQGGGNCRGCHGDASGAPGRRPVDNDFTNGTSPNFRSHHVGNGLTMGGTLTNFDCVVCHGEGEVLAGPDTGTTGVHANGVIDLRNVDNASATFPYDKDSIPGAASTWNSSNATWVTQTSTNLDPFCLTCHDANGAQVHFAADGGSALNPFNDGAITNNYDQWSRGRVTDIASRVVSSGSDLDQAGEARGPDGIPDPPQGIYSRHAIRGQSVSVYTTQQIPNTYWNQTKVAWNDTSVMGCADCHTTDGANGTVGNAHGSSSEYLLKDGSGGATEGSSASTYVCAQCHSSSLYIAGTHTGNGNDFQDYTGSVGFGPNNGRVPEGNTGGNLYGMACTNCHGGVRSLGGTNEFGTIHGTSQTMGTGPFDMAGNPTGTPHQAYRFMNGNSMRFYDPGGWTGSASTCYTVENGDEFGGCVKHGSGQGFTKPAAGQRPLKY